MEGWGDNGMGSTMITSGGVGMEWDDDHKVESGRRHIDDNTQQPSSGDGGEALTVHSI
jgi:hypothetical protein